MASLNVKFSRLNEQLENLFEQLSSCSHQQLNKQPAPHKWSAAQIMHHLMLSEYYSKGYCEKNLNTNSNFKKGGVVESTKLFVLKWYLLAGLKAKAPKSVNTSNLPESDSLENIQQKWRGQRDVLGSWLQSIPSNKLDIAVYKHPYVGFLTITGMIEFFDAHFKHHKEQIIRIVDLKSV